MLYFRTSYLLKRVLKPLDCVKLFRGFSIYIHIFGLNSGSTLYRMEVNSEFPHKNRLVTFNTKGKTLDTLPLKPHVNCGRVD